MDEAWRLTPLRAWPRLPVQGVYRCTPADFVVEECLQPGEAGGEHLWLWLEKTGQNTAWVGQQLAHWAGITARDVGWAGLKDRHAVTRQWFSLYLPGREPPALERLQMEGVRLLHSLRQPCKLRPGAHAGNRFTLVLRQLQGDHALLEQRLRDLQQTGFANAFGPQRFGRGGANLECLQQALQRGYPRSKDSRMISTGRAWLFNEQLRLAIENHHWQQERGWLWGRFHRDHQPDAIQQAVRARYPQLCIWLEGLRMNAAARSYRVKADDLQWQWLAEDVLQLCFSLPPGSFATALLAELGDFVDGAGTALA